MRLAAILTLTLHAPSAWAGSIPDWAKGQSQSLSGSIYKVVCSGHGPSIDLARSEALNSCKASAVSFLQKDGQMKSLAIETESDVSYYQEMSESVLYRNLVCVPERESIDEPASGTYRLWLRCRFDLSKVEVGKDSVLSESRIDSPSSSSNLATVKDRSFIESPGSQRSASRTAINIAVVPGCTKLLVRGSNPRTIICASGLVPVVIEAGDDEIVITANGYMSKTLELRDRAWSSNETIQVILEAH